MPQELNFNWVDQLPRDPAGPLPPSPPQRPLAAPTAPTAPTAPPSNRPSGLNFDFVDKLQPEQKGGNPLTQPIYKTRYGSSLTEKYDQYLAPKIASILPPDRPNDPSYAKAIANELGRLVPQIPDFLASPAGLALLGAHFFPVTRPFAAIIDEMLGVYQGVQTAGEVKAAAKDPSPEKVARALAGVITTAAPAVIGYKVHKESPLPKWQGTAGTLKNAAEYIAGVTPEQQQMQAARGILRHRASEAVTGYNQVRHEVQESLEYVDELTDAERLKAIDNIERSATGRRGVRQSTPELQRASDLITSALDRQWDRLIALNIPGITQHFYENYFPRFFKEHQHYADTINSMFTRRPFTGTQGFRYQRSILGPIRDVVDPAINPNPRLHLVTTNFVELGLMKIQEMKKFEMALLSAREGIAKGYMVKATQDTAPSGWVRINDRIVPKSEMPSGGFLYAPKEVAKSFNSFLAPGIEEFMRQNVPTKLGSWGASKAVGTIKEFNNLSARALVSLSGFHGVLSSYLALTDEAALGLKYAIRGRMLPAAKSFGRAGTLAWAPLEYYFTGDKFLKHSLDPRQYPQFAPYLEKLEQGGGRAGLDTFYRSRANEGFFKQWSAAAKKAGGTGITARVAKTAVNAIMENFVPRIKLGAAMKMIDYEMDAHPNWRNMSVEEQRSIMAKVVDTIDDRHGEIIYDNVFWPRLFKDVGFLGMQFMGWAMGSLRAGVGAASDIPRGVAKMMLGHGGLEDVVTHRVAWLGFGMPLMMGLANAITQKLLTGKYPESLQDYVYPQNGAMRPDGNPDRVVFPWSAYARTYRQVLQDPAGAIESHRSNALAEAWMLFAENADYQHRMIRLPGASPQENLARELAFLLERGTPIAIQRMEQGIPTADEGGTQGTVGALFGVSPAPLSAVRSDAQNLLSDYVRKGGTAISEGVFERRQASATLAAKLVNGRATQKDVMAAVAQGDITPKDASRLIAEAKTPPWEHGGFYGRQFMELEPDQAMAVWRAGTAGEKKTLLPLMQVQRGKILRDMKLERREKMLREMDALIAEYENRPLVVNAPPQVR